MALLETVGDYQFAEKLNSNLERLTEELERFNDRKQEMNVEYQYDIVSKDATAKVYLVNGCITVSKEGSEIKVLGVNLEPLNKAIEAFEST